MNALPQELIEEIVSRTSPVHACGKLSLLSKSFLSAAKSDRVWERFLPVDIISRRVQDKGEYNDPPWDNIDLDTLHAFPSKKELYLFLCDNPLCIDNGAMYFWLDKLSGNKCFHIGPSSLTLGDPEWSWPLENWQLMQTGRFNDIPVLEQLNKVAEKIEIEGKISTSLLSPNATYTAYLLFDFIEFDYLQGFGEGQPLETFVGIDGYGESEKRVVYIPTWIPKYKTDRIPVFTGPQYPVLRKDYWFEIELGNYFNKEGGDNGELRMSLRQVKSGERKSGISLLGIEIRPKSM